jgi:hypothetical protein
VLSKLTYLAVCRCMQALVLLAAVSRVLPDPLVLLPRQA